MNNARRKLEVPMPAAMPCRTRREKYKETNNACIVEADDRPIYEKAYGRNSTQGS